MAKKSKPTVVPPNTEHLTAKIMEHLAEVVPQLLAKHIAKPALVREPESKYVLAARHLVHSDHAASNPEAILARVLELQEGAGLITIDTETNEVVTVEDSEPTTEPQSTE